MSSTSALQARVAALAAGLQPSSPASDPAVVSSVFTAAIAGLQPASDLLTALTSTGQPVLRTAGAGYQVQPDRSIRGPDGQRFIARGITFLDGLFISLETRTDYHYRAVPGQTVTSGLSSQTGYEPTVWGAPDGSDVRARMRAWASAGVNLLRVGIEPAVAYTTAAGGYSSHWAMLDIVVDEANKLGLVVQLQNGNDAVPTALNVAFLAQLAARYAGRRNVWINPANEINCSTGGADCTNPTVWAAEQAQYVAAIRGAGFAGPIVLNATNYGEAVNAVASALFNTATFANDPNLILGVHTYQGAEATFAERLASLQAAWVAYAGVFPLIMDEVGLSHDGTIRDPALDPTANTTTYPVSSPSVLASHYNWTIDLLGWARRMARETAFSGITFFSGSWYVPGLGVHDPNSLKLRDGTWTPFGGYVRDYWLCPPAETTTFAGKSLVNLLYNADMALNTRGFAGGAAATGVGAWDGWVSTSDATSVTRAADGTITLSAGFLRQTVRDLGSAVAGSALVVSVANLVGALNVYVGPPGNPTQFQSTLQAARGRGVGAVFQIPTTLTGDLAVTLAPTSGAAAFKEPQVERGYRPTQFDRRPPAIERAIARQHLQRIGDPAGANQVVGTLVAFTANTLTFAVPYPAPMRAAPASAAFVGTLGTDYGVAVNGAAQSGFTFATQNLGAGGLKVVATSSGAHGLTAASLVAFFTAAGALLLSAE
ncbi:cellulase family glycosylhydrolase [Methylobacterium sp. E-046]|uniref:cellulase family glycosylhydrolase n=1 Tax=Methylobacterium sp. E-046 TaxID=2836576 RepID=UPI001FBA1C88|nr:cellulase family glycosylhydrolase [Methylobacterium sp. E-046]MCJ2102469.1 glycoside hydrolase family 5 protein [Methylobacterium sp. E-046]